MGRKKIWKISKKRVSNMHNGKAYYAIEDPKDSDHYKLDSRVIQDWEDWGFSKEDAERFIESFHALQGFDIKDIKSGRLQVILKEAGLKLAEERVVI